MSIVNGADQASDGWSFSGEDAVHVHVRVLASWPPQPRTEAFLAQAMNFGMEYNGKEKRSKQDVPS